MAKIEFAYSEEYGEVISAIEANELWEFGIISNKKAFICEAFGCSARITCKNMDIPIGQQKVISHYIMSSRKNEHDPSCPHYAEFEEEYVCNGFGQTRNKVPEEKTITFSFNRAEKLNTIVHKGKDTGIIENENVDNKEKKTRQRSQNRKAHLYLLQSLVAKYSICLKNNTADIEKVEIDFGNGKKYLYTYNKLFRQISCNTLDNMVKNNHYIYYGEAYIRKTENGYIISFRDNFLDDKRTVKCVIGSKEINYADKDDKRIIRLNDNSEKKRYVFLFARINVTEKTIFLNIDNLDRIAIINHSVGELREND